MYSSVIFSEVDIVVTSPAILLPNLRYFGSKFEWHNAFQVWAIWFWQ